MKTKQNKNPREIDFYILISVTDSKGIHETRFPIAYNERTRRLKHTQNRLS